MSSSIALPPQMDFRKIVAQNNVSDSNGSFKTVFIVLAAIAVISVISCLIGQCCSRRYLRPRRRRDHVSYESKDLENGLHVTKMEAKPSNAKNNVLSSNERKVESVNEGSARTNETHAIVNDVSGHDQIKSSEWRQANDATKNSDNLFAFYDLPKLFELGSPSVYPKNAANSSNSEAISQGSEKGLEVTGP